MENEPLSTGWTYGRPDYGNAEAASWSQAEPNESRASLTVEASGWTIVNSRWFSTAELPTPTSKVGVDVFVPFPQENPWWTGEVRLELTCPDAEVYDAFVGNRSLTHLFLDEFNHVTFDVPPEVGAALAEPGTCRARLILNVMDDAGTFRLDRLGFE